MSSGRSSKRSATARELHRQGSGCGRRKIVTRPRTCDRKSSAGSTSASRSSSVSDADRRDLPAEVAIEEAKKCAKHLPFPVGGLAVEPCGHTLSAAACEAD